jgi:hypothetical protein
MLTVSERASILVKAAAIYFPVFAYFSLELGLETLNELFSFFVIIEVLLWTL